MSLTKRHFGIDTNVVDCCPECGSTHWDKTGLCEGCQNNIYEPNLPDDFEE